MIKVDIELCKQENGLCSPCLLVTEDTSEERCPIILPEGIHEDDAVKLTEMLKKDIEDRFTTVAEVKKAIYGE